MAPPPPCTALGRQCRSLRLTLRIAQLEVDDAGYHDGLGTWLTGHTERIRFGEPYVEGDRLLVSAEVRVPCRYLREAEANGSGAVRCTAHGFTGQIPRTSLAARPRLRLDQDRFRVMHQRRLQPASLPLDVGPRSLPVLSSGNPCAGARCRTADNRRGAACCRDLIIEAVVPRRDRLTNSLLRTRKSPYLCKVTRAEPDIIEAEVISACGYLAGDRISCGLHGRHRPDGSPAKPAVCSTWPEDLEPGDSGHPGCRLLSAPHVLQRHDG